MVGRNGPCPCGSGKKYKNCCLQGEIAAGITTIKGKTSYKVKEDAEKTFQDGLRFVELNQLKDAAVAFQETVEIDPRHWQAWCNLGRARFESGELQSAVIAYTRAVELKPDLPDIWNGLAVAKIQMNDPVGAKTALERCLKWDPNSPIGWLNLGLVELDLGNPQGAIKAYETAIKFGQNSAMVWNNLGYAKHQATDNVGAIKALEESLRLDPAFIEARVNLGVARDASGDQKGAMREYEEVLRVDDTNPGAWFNVGLLRHRNKDDAGAILAYQKVIDIDPEYAPAWGAMGDSLVDIGKVEEGITAYQKSLEINPRLETGWLNLGWIYQKQGKWVQAKEAFETGLKINPRQEKVWYNLGLIELELNDLQAAVQDFENVVQLNPASVAGWYRLALIFEEINIVDRAATAYEQVSLLAPGIIGAKVGLGWCQLVLGRYGQANLTFDSVVGLEPDRYDVLLLKGVVLAALEQPDSARASMLEGLNKLSLAGCSVEGQIKMGYATLQMLQIVPTLRYSDYQEIFEKILRESGKTFQVGSQSALNNEIPHPFQIAVSWYSWQIAAFTQLLVKKKVGEVSFEELHRLFKILFQNMDLYKDSAPERAPRCLTFWECVQALLSLHETNVTRNLSDFKLHKDHIEQLLSTSNLKGDLKVLFEQLKKILERVNKNLQEPRELKVFQDEINQISEIINDFIGKCLQEEFPYITLSEIIINTLAQEEKFLEAQEKFLEMKELAAPELFQEKPRHLTPLETRLLDQLDESENILRNIIERVMTEANGKDWINTVLLPENRQVIIKRWKSRHQKIPLHRIVDELSFNQYGQIMRGVRRPFFEKELGSNYDSIIAGIDTIGPIRNIADHRNWHLLQFDAASKQINAFLEILREIKRGLIEI